MTSRQDRGSASVGEISNTAWVKARTHRLSRRRNAFNATDLADTHALRNSDPPPRHGEQGVLEHDLGASLALGSDSWCFLLCFGVGPV